MTHSLPSLSSGLLTLFWDTAIGVIIATNTIRWLIYEKQSDSEKQQHEQRRNNNWSPRRIVIVKEIWTCAIPDQNSILITQESRGCVPWSRFLGINATRLCVFPAWRRSVGVATVPARCRCSPCDNDIRARGVNVCTSCTCPRVCAWCPSWNFICHKIEHLKGTHSSPAVNVWNCNINRKLLICVIWICWAR